MFVLDVYGVGEFYEVGVFLVSVGIVIFVEEVLLLCNYVLFFVVQNDDFDVNVELSSGGEFGKGYVKGSIIVDVDDKGIWFSYFGIDGGWQIVVYGIEIIRGDYGVGMFLVEVLSSLYLMLVDISGDVGVFFVVSCEVVEFFNQCLRFD